MVEEPKYTIDGLPVVKEEIGHAIFRDYQSGSLNLGTLLLKIKDENPRIHQYIGLIAEGITKMGLPAHTSENIVIECSIGMIYVYEMLRRQAEANKLTSMYNGNAPK